MVAPLSGLAVNVVIQAGLARARVRLPISIALGFLCGVATGGAVTVYAVAGSGLGVLDSLAFVVLNLVTSGALGFGYFAFVNLNATSVRIRILKEMQRTGRLSPEELAEKYDEKKLMEDRIDRLIRERQLIERDGRYHTGGAFMLFVAKTIAAMKWIVLGRSFDLGEGPTVEP